jgi:hypothetical protein
MVIYNDNKQTANNNVQRKVLVMELKAVKFHISM